MEGVEKGVIVWEEGVVEDVTERVAEVVVVEQKIGKRELIQRRKCQRRSDACSLDHLFEEQDPALLV